MQAPCTHLAVACSNNHIARALCSQKDALPAEKLVGAAGVVFMTSHKVSACACTRTRSGFNTQVPESHSGGVLVLLHSSNSNCSSSSSSYTSNTSSNHQHRQQQRQKCIRVKHLARQPTQVRPALCGRRQAQPNRGKRIYMGYGIYIYILYMGYGIWDMGYIYMYGRGAGCRES